MRVCCFYRGVTNQNACCCHVTVEAFNGADRLSCPAAKREIYEEGQDDDNEHVDMQGNILTGRKYLGN